MPSYDINTGHVLVTWTHLSGGQRVAFGLQALGSSSNVADLLLGSGAGGRRAVVSLFEQDLHALIPTAVLVTTLLFILLFLITLLLVLLTVLFLAVFW